MIVVLKTQLQSDSAAYLTLCKLRPFLYNIIYFIKVSSPLIVQYLCLFWFYQSSYSCTLVWQIWIEGWIRRENSRRFAAPPLVSPQNDVWETSREILHWWGVTTQILVVLLIV